MTAERIARLFVVVLALGLPLGLWLGNRSTGGTVELHGRMAETGGWTPADLTASVGQPLHLRLTSDDVVHGFAIGQSDRPPVDVMPGEVTETTLTFERPGKYTFYCTRWCGPSHWRMRGTIEVAGPDPAPAEAVTPPLYVRLGLDIDAPHPASVTPARTPSAERGAALRTRIPAGTLSPDDYRSHSPAELWGALRDAQPDLSEMEVWDLVAYVWRANTTPKALTDGGRLFAANCAACHGETGDGKGVMAASLAHPAGEDSPGHRTTSPADFTDPASLLGASPALLQGKIIRGGMGTGMPYWGPIFTEAQTWALVDYLFTFVMR